MEVNRKLVEQVNNAKNVILSVEDEIYAYRQALKDLRKAQEKRGILGWIIVFACCECATSLLSSIIVRVLGGINEPRALIVASIVSLIFFIFSMVYWGVIRKKQKAQEYADQVVTLQNIINGQFKKYASILQVVPKDYQSPEAIKILSQIVNSGRALSMQEALNLTEDEFHKRRVEKANQEMLDKLDEIKSNSGDINYYYYD